MFLSRIELAPDASARPAFWRDIATPDGAHHALWRLFRRSSDQPRDFLFRQEYGSARGAGRVRFHVLSRQRPNDAGDGLWRVESTPFAPKLSEGDRLRFLLRASPTVKKSAGKGRQGKRCDVVMDARKRFAADGRPFDPVRVVGAECEDWLHRQAEKAGFGIARGAVEFLAEGGLIEEEERSLLRTDGYRQHALYRKTNDPIRFSTVDFEGVLVVTDPARFLAKVNTGFGPQKAFGCGLMLLRRT